MSAPRSSGLVTRALSRLGAIARALINVPRALWAKEPARVLSVTATVLVALGAHFHVVVDKTSVVEVLAVVFPILLGGEVLRAKVWSPATIEALLTKLGASPELADQVVAAVAAAQTGSASDAAKAVAK